MQEELDKLKAELTECGRKSSEYLDGWQRCKADYVNYKKEVAERERDLETRLSQRIVQDLLPVLESIDLAQAYVKDLDPINNQLRSVLEQYGLIEYGTVGDEFDPKVHESVGVVLVAENEKENIITHIESFGYKLGGRIIKPAKVKISSYV